ncbi:hypothetical protein CXG81DRAFT_20604 [Caulochytrium protostelioides]|uniref:Sucraseferredoxin-like protein n=1 Tax=Caulochytrium protostelioides TaxID=1555241 RepID=A0A4P9WW89_9FUNG|nr:hypothetical protein CAUPRSCDRAFT_10683 [Caulochytrium protostelioides]RKO99297.1 hypothetical protein CXG81DRAFT_20604 [Caulochytrium protostelioides]|eukprot:RKO99297.1 hypothetical protein CXG81DRAFT_20604 [Caulochytrium protostelioides]
MRRHSVLRALPRPLGAPPWHSRPWLSAPRLHRRCEGLAPVGGSGGALRVRLLNSAAEPAGCQACGIPEAASSSPSEHPEATIPPDLLSTIASAAEMARAGVKPYARHVFFRGGRASDWPAQIEAAATDSVGRRLADAFRKDRPSSALRAAAAAAAAASEAEAEANVAATPGNGARRARLPPGINTTMVTCVQQNTEDAATRPYDASRAAEVWCFPERLYFPQLAAEQVLPVAEAIRNHTPMPDDVVFDQFSPSEPSDPLPPSAGDDHSAFLQTTTTTTMRAPRFWLAICGHMNRDQRCGVIGPLLVDAFRRQLALRGLGGKVDVFLTSHYGGHKFAGNLILFSTTAALNGIWYGRVQPRHVADIIDSTLVQGQLVESLYRGRMQPQIASFQWK